MTIITIKIYGEDTDINILSYTAGAPAKLYGSPEECYPAEESEIEWQAATGHKAYDEVLHSDLAEMVDDAIDAYYLSDQSD